MLKFSLDKTHFFSPLFPTLAYLFMAITTLHTQIPFLLTIHIESLTLLWVLFCSLVQLIIHPKKKINYQSPVMIAFLIGLLFMTSPLLSSLVNHDLLALLKDEEYITLFKMILFSPCLLYVMQEKKQRDFILTFIIYSYVLLGFYFLYRYFILHEVRLFDLRPKLNIRNGDANFLCTFFSMMIPLILMQSWKYAQTKNHNFKSFLFLCFSIIIFICALTTQSRMGIIAIFAGAIYLFTRPLYQFSRVKLSLFFIPFIFIFIFYGEHFLKRFNDLQDKSNSDRYLSWVNGVSLFLENPYFGKGIHSAKNYFYENSGYPHFQSEFSPLEIHNTFLKVAAELGIYGIVFFSILYFWPWRKVLQMQTPERYFFISSLSILSISLLTVGMAYKDLIVLHLFLITALSVGEKTI